MDAVPGPAKYLTISIKPPSTVHELSMRKLSAWLGRNGKSSAAQALRV
jgi:hypothetical protein